MITETSFKGIIYDQYFKPFFRYEPALKDFIHSFYAYLNERKEFSFASITVESNLLPTNMDKKQFFSDIVVSLNTGEIVLLEAYTTFGKRQYYKSYHYLYRMYSNQIEKGKKEYEKSNKVICINFMKGNYYRKNNQLVNRFIPKHRETFEDIKEGPVEMIFIRLDLLDKKPEDLYNERERRFIRWLRIISAKSMEELEKIGKGDQIMEQSIEFLKRYAGSELDHGLEDIIEEHAYEAEKKAKKESLLMTAKNMLNLDITVDKIMKATGLTKKEIEALKK